MVEAASCLDTAQKQQFQWLVPGNYLVQAVMLLEGPAQIPVASMRGTNRTSGMQQRYGAEWEMVEAIAYDHPNRSDHRT